MAGPFLDRFSRRKAIYTLDFISAALYGAFAWLIAAGRLSEPLLLGGSFLLGTISSVYQVAYDSFYPMLITEGNYTKAYSISSMMESLSAFMVPVSAVLYNLVGMVPLLLMDMASFFLAAVLETQIRQQERYVEEQPEQFSLGQYRKTFLEGVNYLRQERGLLVITAYFTITMFAGASYNVLALPYFKLYFTNGEYLYILVMGWTVVGRLVGGAVQYRIHYPVEKKFALALLVYIALSLMDGCMLYLPLPLAAFFCLCEGMLGVTSYNIRISATQSYVPDGRKGRFNGIFQMSTMVGCLLGELLAGALSAVMSERLVIALMMGCNLLAAVFLMGGNRKFVQPIYNRES